MTLSLFLDVVMIFLLAGTIFFAWRLSDQIARFRRSRSDMDRLVQELNLAVDRAQKSIFALKDTADTSGEDLQKIMRKATEMSDELQMMTESANNLANRLEQVSARGGVAPSSSASSSNTVAAQESYEPAPRFSIRDSEFDDTGMLKDTDDDWAGVDDLRSEAEKELFKALQKSKKSSGTMM